jgi:methylmalonyl-CoA mutase N-terminal domain/subunit
LTAQQPEVNAVRVAIQALAAVLGGTQSLHTNSQDEALALPSEKAATIALRTQQVIAHETGVANTIDPLGGSFYLEWLTSEMEKRAYAIFGEIDKFGGVIKAIEAGYFQREIAESAFRYQREIDQQKRIIVGVNEYQQDEPLTIPILEFDPDGERRQIARLQELRRTRNNEKVGAALNALREAAQGKANMMPFILDAVKAYATLQEITDVLRKVFGVYQEPVIV